MLIHALTQLSLKRYSVTMQDELKFLNFAIRESGDVNRKEKSLLK